MQIRDLQQDRVYGAFVLDSLKCIGTARFVSFLKILNLCKFILARDTSFLGFPKQSKEGAWTSFPLSKGPPESKNGQASVLISQSTGPGPLQSQFWVPEISEAVTEHEHTSDLWVGFHLLAPVWTSLPPWRILEIHPILHLQLFSGIWKKKDMAFLKSPQWPCSDLLFPPRLFHSFFNCVIWSFQLTVVCLTLETKRALMPDSRTEVAGEETESAQHQKSAESCSGSTNWMTFQLSSRGPAPRGLIWAVLPECGKQSFWSPQPRCSRGS